MCVCACVRAAGKCFCLYPEDRQLPTEAQPHILESTITPTVLFLKRMEIAGLHHCDFIDRPGGIYVKQQNKDVDVYVCLLIVNLKCPFCIFCLVGLLPSNRQALLLGTEPCFTSSDSSRSCTHSFTTDLIPPSVPPKCIHLPKQKLILSPPLVDDSVKMLLYLEGSPCPTTFNKNM